MSERSGAVARTLRLASSPVYATITTVLAVIAGLLGSVYQDDVARAFPLVLHGPWGPLSVRAIVFWFSVVLFAVLFFFRQWSDDLKREQLATTATKVQSGTERVEALVQTMPPRAFQSQLAEMTQGASTGINKLLPRSARQDLTRDDVCALVRSLLNSIARLAMIYDDQPLTPDGSATYAANVMLFVERPSGSQFPTGVQAALRFIDASTDRKSLLGVLVLRPELSATSAASSEPPGPDVQVPAIALPVPTEKMTAGRWNVLPGAPTAFLTGEANGYDDATTLPDWCRKSGNFLPSVIDELELYFSASGDGRSVRSFISRPLIGTDGLPFGVLNLHSNRTDILGKGDERMPAFVAMMTPLLLELRTTLEILRNYPIGG